MTPRTIIPLSALMLMPVWTLSAQGKRPPNKNAVITRLPEAPAGFDNKSNGLVDDPTHQIRLSGIRRLVERREELACNLETLGERNPTVRSRWSIRPDDELCGVGRSLR